MSSAEPRLNVDEQLCFALYAASRAMTARYRPHLDAIGLTYPQFLVMIVLWDDGPSTVSHIGDRLRLDSGTLSPLLKRLEAAELVTKNRSLDDERSVVVEASAKGHALRSGAAGAVEEISRALAEVDHVALASVLLDLEARLRTDA